MNMINQLYSSRMIACRDLMIPMAMLLAACSTHSRIDDSKYGASIGIVNHTNKFIYSAVVNGAGGTNMAAWGAGMAEVCCVMVPNIWYPGMKVTVEWDMPDGSKHNYKRRVVDVEQYDEPGSVYLHFFADDQVRVVVTPYGGPSPKHPIQRPQKPTSLLDY